MKHGEVLTLVVPDPDAPDADVVELAEKLVEHARSGDARAVGIVWVGADRSVSTAFAENNNMADLVYGVAHLQRRLLEVE